MGKQLASKSSESKTETVKSTPSSSQQDNPILMQEFAQQSMFSPQAILAAQGLIGNQAVMRMIATEQPMLRIGSKHPAVEQLQNLLNERIDANLNVDGIFGPLTQRAVRDFQQANKLVPDGIVGPLTWGSLRSGGNDKPPNPAPPDEQTTVGQQLVSSLRSFKSVVDGFGIASEGESAASSASNLADVGTDSSDAMTEVKTVLGDVSQNLTDGTTNAKPRQFALVQSQQSLVEPKVAVPELFKEINDAVKNLPATLQTGFQTTLGQMKVVVDQIKGGTDPTADMVTQFNQATADLLKVANSLNVPASGGSETKFDLKKPSFWKVKGSTIADVGQELETHASTHGEAAHVQLGSIDTKVTELSANNLVKKITIKIPIDMELPEWSNAATVGQSCPCWKKEWDKFSAAIKAHEEQHVAIYKLYFSNLHLRCLNKTEDEAFKLIDATQEAAERAQEQFDNATNHGIKGVPSTAFNAGISCNGC